jgi:hypothetical protein
MFLAIKINLVTSVCQHIYKQLHLDTSQHENMFKIITVSLPVLILFTMELNQTPSSARGQIFQFLYIEKRTTTTDDRAMRSGTPFWHPKWNENKI